MRREQWKWALAVACVALLAVVGCAVFVPGTIKRSESIDHAVVVATLRDIEAGVLEYRAAYEILAGTEETEYVGIKDSMRERVDWMYMRKVEEE